MTRTRVLITGFGSIAILVACASQDVIDDKDETAGAGGDDNPVPVAGGSAGTHAGDGTSGNSGDGHTANAGEGGSAGAGSGGSGKAGRGGTSASGGSGGESDAGSGGYGAGR